MFLSVVVVLLSLDLNTLIKYQEPRACVYILKVFVLIKSKEAISRSQF